jgi:hypothetical protein
MRVAIFIRPKDLKTRAIRAAIYDDAPRGDRGCGVSQQSAM